MAVKRPRPPRIAREDFSAGNRRGRKRSERIRPPFASAVVKKAKSDRLSLPIIKTGRARIKRPFPFGKNSRGCERAYAPSKNPSKGKPRNEGIENDDEGRILFSRLPPTIFSAFIFTVGRSLATNPRINFLVTLSRSIPSLTRRDPIARPGFALYSNRT